jgi:xylulokinase
MSDSDKFILAIDLGTSGPKVALISVQGVVVDSEFEETRLLLLPEGGAEQSPQEWWEAIDKATKRLLGKRLIPAEEIEGVICTGQWSGTVPVDQEGNALSNAIIWMDSRGAPYINKILDGPLKIQGYALQKLLKWIQRTGGIPATAGKDPIAHILYLKHVHPEVYQCAYKFLEPVDYLGLRLTGYFAASYNSITAHWLTDNRNVTNIRYDRDLIKFTTMDPEKLPALKPTNGILGTLRVDIAREWGLRENVQVIMSSPDMQTAAVGSGAVKDYEPHLYIGTSSWLMCHVPFKKTDLLHDMAAIPSAIPGRYVLTNEQECAGVCLQHLRDNIFFYPDELSTGAKPVNAYQLFDEIAARTAAGSDRLIFTPWLYGERSPVDDHYVRGGFFNQSLHTTREHLVRSVFEGVAYNSRWLLKYVEQFIKRRVDAINMVGGGAKSDIWCQIHADVLGRRIRQVKDPILVNVRGAGLLASAALGYIRYQDIASRVPIAREYEPNPDHRKIYNELFEEFTAIYQSNHKIYARLNRGQQH